MPDPDDEAVQVRYVLWRDQRTVTDAEFDAQREAELRGEPRPWPLSEEMLSHREREAYLERLRALPRRVLPTIVSTLPDWLMSAEDGAEIRVFDGQHDRLERAGVLRYGLNAAMRTQAAGRLRLREVAAVLAEPHDRAIGDLADALIKAAASGDLCVWISPHERVDPASEGVDGIREREAMNALHTRPEDVDAWLGKIDPDRRLSRFPAGPWTAARLPTQQPNEGRESTSAVASGPAPAEDAASGAPLTRKRFEPRSELWAMLERQVLKEWGHNRPAVAEVRGAILRLAALPSRPRPLLESQGAAIYYADKRGEKQALSDEAIRKGLDRRWLEG